MAPWIDLAAVFLPLAGFLVAGLGGHKAGDRFAGAVTCALMLIAACLSFLIFQDVALEGHARTHVLAPWIEAGGLKANWALRLDTLSSVMLLVVNGVSAMVHVYAVGYMHGDKGLPRFMAYLSLFTFFMLMLVCANDLLQLFFGWEGVGLASYLLIGFWYEKPSASAAAMKAFLVNRVGDFGFILGIFGCFALTGSIGFDEVFKTAPLLVEKTFSFGGFSCAALTVVTLLLFMGAMGKSAQIGLHTWLPDAMEGPTPVSALIHAATMVTAGVFMVARLSPLFEYAPATLAFIALVGAATAFIAATIGLTQFDIKKVIAYSTMSQLGYMFFAAGVSAYGASMFHLMTHAFFKALLFLAAGSVIHAMAGEQDMRKMGGLARKIPVTYALMWIGSLALAGIGIEGVFGFAGFYSKDMILEAALARGTWFGTLAYLLGLMAAFMTAFYSWRLLFLTFHGKGDAERLSHAHESPWIMLAPLVPLALGAVGVGYLAHDWFASAPDSSFWQNTLFVAAGHAPPEGHEAAALARFAPLVAALLGIGASWLFYIRQPEKPAQVAARLGRLYRLVLNKYYVDELYDRLFVRTAPRFGAFLWRMGDDKTIDGLGPDGIAALTGWTGGRLRLLQTGYLYHYATLMAIGLILLLGWAMINGGL